MKKPQNLRRQFRMVAPILLSILFPLTADARNDDRPIDAARIHFRKNVGAILEEFVEFLSIPNVWPDHDDIRRNAEWIVNAFARRGVSLECIGLKDAPPIVLGSLKVSGASRTLGLYAHYDGQPVDPERWVHSPWTPVLYTRAMEAGGETRPMPGEGEAADPEWRLYARSSGDDKAPIIAILAALDAMRADRLSVKSNLVFLFEGEEESGSRRLREYMDLYQERLAADVWLILDGPVHQSRRPQLVFGVRGITGLEITVYGACRHLHSGHYGNWAPNPAMRLARLLASMTDPSGRVVIEGFYDSTIPPGPAIEAAAATIPEFEDALREEYMLAASESSNAPYLEQMMKPSLNVRGLRSASVGSEARNVIPATAVASLDLRLAKGDVPARMLDLVEDHIRKQGYHITREEPGAEERLAHYRIAKVTRHEGYPAVRTEMDLPVMRWVRQRTKAAAGEGLVLMPTLGGSLPLYLFEEKLRSPIVICPISNHDNNQHGPNENIRLGNLAYGVALMASLFGVQ